MRIPCNPSKFSRNVGKPWLAALSALLITAPALAESSGPVVSPDGSEPKPLIDFSDVNLVNFAQTRFLYLYGVNLDTPFNPTSERDLITVEHYNDNAIGDLFFFVDIENLATEGEGGPPSWGTNFFAEISPRVSLGKITGKEYKFGPVKDIFIYSGTLEVGSSGTLDEVNKTFALTLDTTQLRQLHGIGFAFDLPGFAYSAIDIYWRDDFDLDGSTWQVTLTWGIPFELAGLDFFFSGFFDLAGEEDTSEINIITSPRIMVDVGKPLFGINNRIYAGVEFTIWMNEFGIKDQDEFIPQFGVQINF